MKQRYTEYKKLQQQKMFLNNNQKALEVFFYLLFIQRLPESLLVITSIIIGISLCGVF